VDGVVVRQVVAVGLEEQVANVVEGLGGELDGGTGAVAKLLVGLGKRT
jgi:hypothetical protein